MKDDIDGRYDIPEEDITEVGFFENSFADISPDNDSIFGRDLLPCERIIFTAQGKSGKGSLFKKVFAIVWMLFVIVWVLTALGSRDGFAAIFGLPHTIIGIIMLFQAGFIRTKVSIAVTDKRLLIRYLGKTQAVYLNQGEKQGRAMILPADNDSYWNISFEGIRGIVTQRGEESGNCLFDTFELPREDAVKLAGIIDRIIKGEYI